MSEQPKYRIEIFWSEEDGGYIANIPELKYTSAFGETREEAFREILVAEELHLETLEEMGRDAPEPRDSQRRWGAPHAFDSFDPSTFAPLGHPIDILEVGDEENAYTEASVYIVDDSLTKLLR